MNWQCQHCAFEFQLDDNRIPSYAFATECPRCRKNITVTPPPRPEPTLKMDGAASSTQAIGAPTRPANAAPQDMTQAFMQMMATMVGGAPVKGTHGGTELLSKSFAWQRKQVLICHAEPTQRDFINNILDKSAYEPTIAQSSAHALEVMHDTKMDIVLLDPQFDSARQGGIAILRHISSLMPKYRRRVYAVLISSQVKTLDTYMAFLNCVNLTVNTDDLEALPAILERSIKDYNELYRPYYEASNLSPF